MSQRQFARRHDFETVGTYRYYGILKIQIHAKTNATTWCVVTMYYSRLQISWWIFFISLSSCIHLNKCHNRTHRNETTKPWLVNYCYKNPVVFFFAEGQTFAFSIKDAYRKQMKTGISMNHKSLFMVSTTYFAHIKSATAFMQLWSQSCQLRCPAGGHVDVYFFGSVRFSSSSYFSDSGWCTECESCWITGSFSQIKPMLPDAFSFTRRNMMFIVAEALQP